MAIIFVLSATPDLNSGLGDLDLIGRKVLHMVTYAVLTWLWFWTLRGSAPRPMLSAVVISVLYSISDEYHQHFVEGRHGSPVDVAIDSIGIAGVVWWEERKRRLRASRAPSP